jgi:probable HAF family extracellular repeat protein
MHKYFLYLACLFCLSGSIGAATQQYRITNLGEVIGTNSYAQGINNHGQVVGYWHTTAGTYAFLYSGGVATNLAELGDGNHYALSINNFGQVAGFAEATNNTQGTVFNIGTYGAA